MSHFKEVLYTLGGTDLNLQADTEYWSLWNVVFPTPATPVKAAYLYIKSRCPLKEATEDKKSMWAKMSPHGEYNVILTPSSLLNRDRPQTLEAFKGKSITTSSELLFNNLLASLNFRHTEEEQYFIEPKLSVGKETLDATRYLAKWASGGMGNRPSEGNITVIKAHGGIGKTTLCRVLCNKLRTKPIFPILIESSQWQSHLGPNFAMRDIWDIAIARSFDVPSKLLSNEMALRVLIREGIFIPVLDGFDELCLNPAGNQGPEEIISQLLEMVASDEEDEPSSARLIITTRDSFWNSLHVVEQAQVSVVTLHGFSNDQKKEYFDKRLKNPAERDTAQRLASEISGKLYPELPLEGQASERPEGVPFILDMIASYVHENPDPKQINPYSGDPLAPLLEAMCRRENVRQKLDIDHVTQLSIFEELFREFSENIPENSLNEYIHIIANKDDPAIWKRFKSHVFLRRRTDGDFECKYEVLKVYFIARYLARELQDTSANTQKKKVAEILAKNATGSTEVLDWLAGQLLSHKDERIVQALQHARLIISSVESASQFRASGTALFNLLARFIEDVGKTEKALRLHQLIGEVQDKLFNQIVLSGPVRSYDFSGYSFDGCCISNVEFKNCLFDENTIFSNCVFAGTLEFSACQNEYSAGFLECKMSPHAEMTVCEVKGRPSPEEVRKKFAEEVLRAALGKFKGQFGFTSIQYRRRMSGLPAANPFLNRIWDILLKKDIIEKHNISNVTDGGLNISDNPETRRDVRVYLESGFAGHIIKNAIDALISDL